MLGLALTVFVILGLIGVGVGALVAPRVSSLQFGILLGDARSLAFIRAMGARDLVIGGLLALLLVAGRRDLLAVGLAASAAIALVDLAVVSRDVPPEPAPSRRRPRLLHGLGALGLLAAACVVALGW